MKSINFPSKPQLYLAIAILALVIFYLSKCRPTPEPQLTTTTRELRDTLNLIEKDRKYITDSFLFILEGKEQANYQNESDFIKLLNENSELSAINARLQNEVYPDTCKDVVKKYRDAFGNYEYQTNKTLEQGKKTIIGLSSTVETQKKFIAEKDVLYSRIKNVADTCLYNSALLEKYIKKINPKRSINLNVQAISPYAMFKPIFGIGLGYENKKRLEVSVTYYTNQQISIGIRKPLFKF